MSEEVEIWLSRDGDMWYGWRLRGDGEVCVAMPGFENLLFEFVLL
jgi:hypothetical protein